MERDLRQRYSDRYRVMSCRLRAQAALEDPGPAGTRRSEPVALLLADHRMPRMNGIDLLTAAIGRSSLTPGASC